MKVNLICAVIASAFLFVATAFANEPHWTPQERTEQRAAVLRGTVLSVTKLKAINDREDLMSAEIRVAQVLKKTDNLPEKIVTVFYATSPQGAGRRCPAYVVLVPDQTATFYLSYHKDLTKKEDFIIEMGSDVIKQDAPDKQPDAKEKSPIRSPEVGTKGSAKEVEAAKLQGAETAAADIKAGVLRILYYGEPYPLKPLVDEATGYRVQIVAGCIVSKQFVAETDAYNQAMREWHAKNSLAPPPFKPGIRNVEPPVGSLGYPVGSYLTIEGVREDQGKVGIRTLRVDTINGHKLDQPVGIWVNGVELPAGERCIFKGYETGQWIGVPEEVLHATGRPAPQAGWQFKFSFSPTSVVQPKNLEIK